MHSGQSTEAAVPIMESLEEEIERLQRLESRTAQLQTDRSGDDLVKYLSAVGRNLPTCKKLAQTQRSVLGRSQSMFPTPLRPAGPAEGEAALDITIPTQHTYIYTHIQHTYIHTYIYICVCVCVRSN